MIDYHESRGEVNTIATEWFRKYKGQYNRANIFEVEDLEQEIWSCLLGNKIPQKKIHYINRIVFLSVGSKELNEEYFDGHIGGKRYIYLYANKYLDRKPGELINEYYPGEFRNFRKDKMEQVIWSGEIRNIEELRKRAEKLCNKLRMKGGELPVEIPISQLNYHSSDEGKNEMNKINNLFYATGRLEDDYGEESFA